MAISDLLERIRSAHREPGVPTASTQLAHPRVLDPASAQPEDAAHVWCCLVRRGQQAGKLKMRTKREERAAEGSKAQLEAQQRGCSSRERRCE